MNKNGPVPPTIGQGSANRAVPKPASQVSVAHAGTVNGKQTILATDFAPPFNLRNLTGYNQPAIIKGRPTIGRQ